ncbi:MAG: hypothetical protein FWF95_06235 [Syntrophorhabdaceae bacterium]|nr:hypothetical protein [Syntrophorhabdaceae bacterium]
MKKTVVISILICTLLCLSGHVTKPAEAAANSPAATDRKAGGISPQISKLLARADKDDLLIVLANPSAEEYKALNAAAANARSYEIQPGGEVILLVPLKDNLNIAVHTLKYQEDTGELNITGTPAEFAGKLNEPIKLKAFLSEGIPSMKLTVVFEDRWAEWLFAYDGAGLESARFLRGVSASGSVIATEEEERVRHILENTCKETRDLIAAGMRLEYSGNLTKIDGLDYYVVFVYPKTGEDITAAYAVNAEHTRVYRSNAKLPNYTWVRIKID